MLPRPPPPLVSRQIGVTFARLPDGQWDVRPDASLGLAALPDRWRANALRTCDPALPPPHLLTITSRDPLWHLLEASDPTTPGERLRAMLDERGGANRPNNRETALERRIIQDAVLMNPSLPLDVLRVTMLASGISWQEKAWRNPAALSLLLTDPRPEYRRAAARMLEPTGSTPRSTLDELVEYWAGRAARRAPRSVPPSKEDRWCDLARHLAGLFSLPWPDDR
jgi:hypothetical protein